jgi:hypothetical protein
VAPDVRKGDSIVWIDLKHAAKEIVHFGSAVLKPPPFGGLNRSREDKSLSLLSEFNSFPFVLPVRDQPFIDSSVLKGYSVLSMK